MSKATVSSISFENYKAFKERQVLKLKPLTLLFGYNNTGKSAAVRLLPLLAKSFQPNRPQTYLKSYLNYNAACVRGATFRDIAYGQQSKMQFSVAWEDNGSVELDLRQNGMEAEVLASLKVENGTVEGAGRTYKFIQHISETGQRGEYEYEDVADKNFLVRLDGLKIFPMDKEKEGLFDPLHARMHHFAQSVYWLNSIRVHPPREFAIGAGVEIGVKFDGRNTAETLWHLGEHQTQSFQEINEWLIEACGRKIDISTVFSNAEGNGRRTVRLETSPVTDDEAKRGRFRVAILDSGEGIAQALPVVTLCAQAANGELGDSPIIAIEQPELHLHPRATVAMANFLVKCIRKSKNVRFVIETHSENLLLALQTALVEKTLLVDEVACYWAQSDPLGEGSTLTEISFDEEGYVSEEWPEDVFSETVNQAKELLKKRGL
jgi:predicted ATPase